MLTLATTPLAKKLAIRLGAIDMPGKKGTESERHLHTTPTPRMGGLAIYIGCCAAILLFVPMTDKVLYMLLGSIIIVVLGVLDDIYNLRPLVKLVVQLLAAGVAVYGGNVIRFFSSLSAVSDGSNWNLGVLSVPVSILWIVTITNAVNLIDGLDGLAAGVSTISAISMVLIALTYSNYSVAVITGALAGACIGFLPYNKPPAKIFMGDTGSTFIGYILAVASIQGLFKFYALISFVIPFLMLGLPIFDICYAFILRISHGENPMHADRKHVHYRLIDMGLSKKQTVAVLYAASAILGLTSVICTTSGLVRALVVLAAVGLVGLVSLRMYVTHLHAMRGRMEEGQDRPRPLPGEGTGASAPKASPQDAAEAGPADADPAQQG
ncbi:MAG: undecaprenyl/decaprenyl-phosphate alpha-N-acetylglucosaminyl 1-phosphate transferase [Clostridiales bacterium]|nr:undecaprenyl/decaprenyl-phosphate alpha-N-acetylglucosaminyl 1-phosphate transferase [Clostridiales bacterium]MCC8099200.1 undecaprenyl/decaprenyl-phosphate alpha-N-acetylglucosaminyl 1-phosphate transferase [Clostridiales bacterium]